MLEAWKNFKICGPVMDDEDGVEWVVFGQRQDGAVFWRTLFVARHQDFWSRIALVFERFDAMHAHQGAPEKSYVPFEEVGVWFDSTKRNGEWRFK